NFSEVPYLNISILDVSMEQEDTILSNSLYYTIIKQFSRYEWKLEEDNEKLTITPSILGNVFEKYINQKEMGAYYTEQDTTDYITQNSIITALVNKLYHKEKFIKIMVSSLI